MKAERGYTYSVDNALREAYGYGVDATTNMIHDYIDSKLKNGPDKAFVLNVFYKAIDKYYEHAGNGIDVKNRLLKEDRDKIAELARSIS